MEIELKFELPTNESFDLAQVLTSLNVVFQLEQPKLLTNAYYETAEQTLRQFDIGLRIRQVSLAGVREYTQQTVKLAGNDIGGLQQRPEYNVELDNDFNVDAQLPDLSLFDASIWPHNFPVKQVQSDINTLFVTEFTRHTALVTLANGAKIECVYDSGNVSSDGRLSPINEVELELISGRVEDIMTLASQLIQQQPMKLGSQSKAAKGYLLHSDRTEQCHNLEPLIHQPNVVVETAFTDLINKAISYIQHHERVFATNLEAKPLRRILDGVSLLIHTLELFSELLPNSRCDDFIKQFSHWRKQHVWVDPIYQVEQLKLRQNPYRGDIDNNQFLSELLSNKSAPISELEQAAAAFYQPKFNHLMIDLLAWVAQKQWRCEISLQQLPVLNQPLTEVSSKWLQQSWLHCSQHLQEVTDIDDHQQVERCYWPLAKGLLTGICVGSLYPTDEWRLFRDQLVNLLVGLEELMMLNKLNRLINKELLHNENESQTQLKWLAGKQSSLQMAINASIANVKKLTGYW